MGLPGLRAHNSLIVLPTRVCLLPLGTDSGPQGNVFRIAVQWEAALSLPGSVRISPPAALSPLSPLLHTTLGPGS